MKKILSFLLLACPVAAFAQTTYDQGLSFGARATVEADWKLASGLHLLAHEETRYYSGSEEALHNAGSQDVLRFLAYSKVFFCCISFYFCCNKTNAL